MEEDIREGVPDNILGLLNDYQLGLVYENIYRGFLGNNSQVDLFKSLSAEKQANNLHLRQFAYIEKDEMFTKLLLIDNWYYALIASENALEYIKKLHKECILVGKEFMGLVHDVTRLVQCKCRHENELVSKLNPIVSALKTEATKRNNPHYKHEREASYYLDENPTLDDLLKLECPVIKKANMEFIHSHLKALIEDKTPIFSQEGYISLLEWFANSKKKKEIIVTFPPKGKSTLGDVLRTLYSKCILKGYLSMKEQNIITKIVSDCISGVSQNQVRSWMRARK